MYIFNYIFIPLIICAVCLIITEKITKGRCGRTEYAIIMIIVNVFQISISYYPLLMHKDIWLAPFVLLALFCINIHFSTKRYNDAVIEKSDKYLVYFSPVSTSILFVGHFALFLSFFILNEPRVLYLLLLIAVYIIPMVALCFKENDISIKNTDVPVKYRSVLSELYLDKNVNLVIINDDFISINNTEYSIRYYQNKRIITSNRYFDSENILAKYLIEKGLQRLGFHYKNVYFELTDEIYSNMIAEIKNMENVILIEYPFLIINNVNIFIRKNGMKYSIVFLKQDKEKLINEINNLKKISKERENEEYVCYEGIKRKEIIWWIKQY